MIKPGICPLLTGHIMREYSSPMTDPNDHSDRTRQLVSNTTYPSTTVSQNIDSIPFQTGTISFDWKYMVSSRSRGPPSTKCTLAVTLSNGFITPASWTYPGTQGGGGHVETTFGLGIGGGDMTFTFSCTDLSSTFQGGALIDNVKFSGC